ncbi:uncharacterized protein LOC111709393 [Eurytemora carolleeae]|uniref:uncharacterized protein LOC111709393 n=1 Tax=Eurytemora carolleeae TaxID=1294199 RepID=UPI000C78FE96|nr:uncharacterized protein LOC111709393 [Eurytemora carolleeae]|eukprot:XP_023338812.1 uncharacterized protein LOC111709393 [Eurytemora affinis]
MNQVLQEYNREKKERERIHKEEKKIMLLQQKMENLESREKAFLKTINTGEYSGTTDSSMDVAELTVYNIENLFQICKSKQKLESLALMYGITAWKHENGQIHFTFDPYIRGQHKGAYIIRMMPNQGKMNLLGHSLPHAVPVHKLYAKYTEDASKDSSKTLATFLDTSFRWSQGIKSEKSNIYSN